MRGLLASYLEELPASGEDSVRTVFKKKPKSLQIFSRQFATMIEAGLNVVSALVILEEQTDDKYLAQVIRELRADVEGGLLLSQALGRHPKVFSRLYVSMVEAGEAAGILDQVLDRVAFQIEKDTQIKRRVKGAMIYPVMVLIFATLVLIGMLMFLVPIFVKIFSQLGGELPTLTQWVVAASDLMRTLVHHHSGNLRNDRRLPALEEDRKRTQGLGPDQAPDPDAHRPGRPEGHDGAVLRTFDARRGRCGHHQGAGDHRADGRQLGRRGRARHRPREGARRRADRAALIDNDVFPPMVAQMVKIGEETESLEKMLSKIADFYEDEVDSSIQSLTSIIEPLMMIAVGCMVGVIIIATICRCSKCSRCCSRRLPCSPHKSGSLVAGSPSASPAPDSERWRNVSSS